MAAGQGLIGSDGGAGGGPAVVRPADRRGAVSAWLARRRRLQLALLLAPPVTWLVVAYLGAIGLMLASSFWTIDSFTGTVVHSYTSTNLHDLVTDGVYRTVTVRTLVVAVAVTLIDIVIALPMAFVMTMVAIPRWRPLLVVAVLTPLWASYLVKAYAWRTLLAPDGPLAWLTGGRTPGYGLTATVITLAYLWLPYMIIPIYAGMDRIPRSLFEASADLGGGAVRTVRSVLLPLLFPAIAAGSIFTFSLTLGDYITVGLVGGRTQLVANLIAGQVIENQPLAAALTLIPLVAVVLYLVAMRRTGALENV